MSRLKSSKSQSAMLHVISAMKEILQEGVVGTQEAIIQALAEQRIHINQSKASRLLRKVGAVKIINDQGESIYSLQREPMLPSAGSSLARLIIDVMANESLIVIHTNPGSASLIARLLDHRTQELQILGTVAGDDTLLVVPKSTQHIKVTLAAVKKQLYGVE